MVWLLGVNMDIVPLEGRGRSFSVSSRIAGRDQIKVHVIFDGKYVTVALKRLQIKKVTTCAPTRLSAADNPAARLGSARHRLVHMNFTRSGT